MNITFIFKIADNVEKEKRKAEEPVLIKGD